MPPNAPAEKKSSQHQLSPHSWTRVLDDSGGASSATNYEALYLQCNEREARWILRGLGADPNREAEEYGSFCVFQAIQASPNLLGMNADATMTRRRESIWKNAEIPPWILTQSQMSFGKAPQEVQPKP